MQIGWLALGLLWRYYGTSFALRKLTSDEDRRERDAHYPAAYKALHDARDAAFVAELDKVVAEGPRRVAVLYGSSHMRAAIRCLTKAHGYRITKARWLTVVTY